MPGHWEGGLIFGLGSSAIGTLVERTTRFTILLHLPCMDAYGQPRGDNAPALAGHGAEAVRDAIASRIMTLPEQLRRSLTRGQGAEMAQHAQLRIDTGLQVYFCDPDPYSAWQRATNENTNGLLRQYFPKGTDLSRHTPTELDAVAAALNSRPRKTLGYKTPAEALNEHLLSLDRNGLSAAPGRPVAPPKQAQDALARRLLEHNSHDRRGEPRRLAARTHPPDQIHLNNKAVLQRPLEPGRLVGHDPT